MARVEDWLDRPGQSHMATRDIVLKQPVKVYVYRSDEQSAGVGFDHEVSDQENRRMITVRLDKSKTQGVDLVGLTEETDVRKDDTWLYTDRNGINRKLIIDKIYHSERSTEVELSYAS